jgi:hypothetical protein
MVREQKQKKHQHWQQVLTQSGALVPPMKLNMCWISSAMQAAIPAVSVPSHRIAPALV